MIPRLRLSPVVAGTICCILAALGYTGVNICVRILTVRCDRVMLLLVKEIVAVALVGPWLMYSWRRKGWSIGWRHLVALVVAGVLTQLGGNLPFIWAMAIVGLAVAVTVTLGTNLIASAVLGRLSLGERVSAQSVLAIALLIGSVLVLTLGAQQAAESVSLVASAPPGTLWVLLAVAAVCGAGIVYGILSAAIRHSMTAGVPLGFVAFIVPAMAIVCLGPACWWRLGAAGLAAVTGTDFLLMLLCGLLNLIAYVAFIKGLELTSMVHANVLVASEVAMAAVAGVLFFGEAASPALLLGVAMTIAGMVLIDRRAAPEGSAEE